MAAMFAGASRALLASVVFAFETTRQPLGLLPLLGGCSVAFLVSAALMKHRIMTEKIARRGAGGPAEYAADWLSQWRAGERSSRPVVTLGAAEKVDEALRRLAHVHHQGFPVVDGKRGVLGVVMRRTLAAAPPGTGPSPALGRTGRRSPSGPRTRSGTRQMSWRTPAWDGSPFSRTDRTRCSSAC